eukprot:567288-Alexandrium_andersonii.AAC.1
MGRRHAAASPHFLDHLLAVEVLLSVSITSGFSFGVPKAQILGGECLMLGERVGCEGRWATDDHISAVERMKP